MSQTLLLAEFILAIVDKVNKIGPNVQVTDTPLGRVNTSHSRQSGQKWFKGPVPGLIPSYVCYITDHTADHCILKDTCGTCGRKAHQVCPYRHISMSI